MATSPTRARVRRWSRRSALAIVPVLLLLLAVRAALPWVVLHYANRTLAEVPDYHGRIRDVDLALWRGAYRIEGLEIVKTGGEIPVPFFSCPRIDLSVEWKALLEGALVGEIDFRSPVVNLVAGPTESETQTPVDGRWQDKVEELFPLRINRFEVHDGRLHYRNFHSSPKVNVPIDDVHVLATNLTNSRDLSGTLVAEIEADGRPLGDAVLELDVEIDPYATEPTFDLTAKLENVALTKLNDFLRAYGGVDAESGTLDVYAELASADGAFTGYVKPLLHDLSLADPGEDLDTPFEAAWEGLVSLLSILFRNLPEDRLGTKVEFSGRFEEPRYSLWAVIGEVLRNAFIEALSPRLEGEVDLGDANESRREERAGDRPARGTPADPSLTGALGAALESPTPAGQPERPD